METVLPEPVQETKNPEWQMVETKTKKKKKKKKNGSKKKVQTKQRSRRLRSRTLVIKPTEGKVIRMLMSLTR